MFEAVLTQSSGILGPIATLLGWILNGIYEFLGLFGIHNVALVIVLFTFIVRGLMTPLTIKQQKFSKLSAKMNPELTAITAKYKGKKDEASMKKQQAETQSVYMKYGANPTSGCLPLLIQLPIMFALYQVIYRIPAYVNDINVWYNNIGEAILHNGNYIEIMKEFAKTTQVNLKTFTEMSGGTLTPNHIIDILAKFSSDNWNELITKFPTLETIIRTNSIKIIDVNSLFNTINILDRPGLKFPGILIPFLAAGFQFIQTKQMMAANPTPIDKDNPMSASMGMMNNVMPIMSGVFCFMFPVGIGIYWIAGSIFAIGQQFIINRILGKVDIDDMIKRNVEKASKKKAKLGLDPNATLEDLAKKQTKSISSKVQAPESTSSTAAYANVVKKNYGDSNSGKSDVSYKPGSISANANLLKTKNKDNKGDK
ncbi:YidC/Oxa1 family membrane protein insertase [Anaerocolumna xylanovorans]|uniref:YidC/Oxa1 family membrane protein insertase n=1 Tax=Anaerocolumna xylanovorans DSM 12503 TaxID=1121345 RepID=A0A1M7YNW7_9FIRM|nr:YidC/Oxa1 family membrane protein insertase [Anaerocolumna xylanovorans]SHO54268.1 YidC/Oxa1 family membrane protein insertase [Anaerocolumna xylanovorans DSM 12503]